MWPRLIRTALFFCFIEVARPQTPTPVTFAFQGTSRAIGQGQFLIIGSGLLTPFGGAQATIQVQPLSPGMRVIFQFNFNNGAILQADTGAFTPVSVGSNGISGTAFQVLHTTNTFGFSITPAFTSASTNTVVSVTGSGMVADVANFAGAVTAGYPVSEPGGSGYTLTAGNNGSSTTCLLGADVSPVPGGSCAVLNIYRPGSASSAAIYKGASGGISGPVIFGVSDTSGQAPPLLAFSGSGLHGGVVLLFNGQASGASSTINIAIPTQPVAATYEAKANCPVSIGNCWLTIPAASTNGTVPASSSASFAATVNPQGLNPGVHQANVTIKITPNGGAPSTLDVSVTVLLDPSASILALSQSGLQFQSTPVRGAVQQFVTVSNSGSAPLPFAATPSTVSGGNWLTVTPSSGMAPGSSSVQVVNIQANPTGLSPGLYLGRVDFSAPGASNALQSVEVAFTVLLNENDTVALASPASLIFVALPGETPAPQSVQIYNVSGNTYDIKALSSYQQGSGWFSLSEQQFNQSSYGQRYSGDPCDTSITQSSVENLCPSFPVQETVTVDPSALPAGVFLGTLDLDFRGAGLEVPVPITLVVTAPAPQPGVPAPPPCTPGVLVPVVTNLSGGFQAVAGVPIPLQVEVLDDCGSPLASGSVVAYSPGANEPQVSLTSLGNGHWTGSWTQHNLSGSAVEIGVLAASLTAPLYGSAGVSGFTPPNLKQPVVNAGAVVSAASLANTPISPGSSISIFGSNLAAAANSASSLPLPVMLGGTQVLLGGVPLLLNYVGPDQINAIVPYATPVNSLQQLIVMRNGIGTIPETAVIAAASPAVFTQNQSGTGAGVIIVVKQNGKQFLNTPSARASAGDALTIYCAGLGAVTPAVADGTPAPSSSPARTVNPVTVTIGGKDAVVQFAGLAPGFAGLYQVNATVPSGISSGADIPLILSVAGYPSPPVTVAIQ